MNNLVWEIQYQIACKFNSNKTFNKSIKRVLFCKRSRSINNYIKTENMRNRRETMKMKNDLRKRRFRWWCRIWRKEAIRQRRRKSSLTFFISFFLVLCRKLHKLCPCQRVIMGMRPWAWQWPNIHMGPPMFSSCQIEVLLKFTTNILGVWFVNKLYWNHIYEN